MGRGRGQEKGILMGNNIVTVHGNSSCLTAAQSCEAVQCVGSGGRRLDCMDGQRWPMRRRIELYIQKPDV